MSNNQGDDFLTEVTSLPIYEISQDVVVMETVVPALNVC